MSACEELERRARARLDPCVFDYFAGGAGDERTLSDNVSAWERLALRPTVGVGRQGPPDCSLMLLGQALAAPVLLAPVAAQRLLDPEGELAGARAAGRAGTVYCLSTRATADLGEVAGAASGPCWFQLYVEREREHSERALRRLVGLGYTAVVLTADLPVAGRRERELRRGPLPLPAGIRMATHGSPAPAHDLAAGGVHKPAVGGWDPGLTWADLDWVAQCSGLPVLVKGLLTGEDAALAVEHGAAGVIVSNHGGRQLDGALPTAVALPQVVAAVDARVPVLVDGGVRSGTDVLRALALGADAVMVGRAYAWALAAGGEAAVAGLLARLARELGQAMLACGVGTLADVGPQILRPGL